MGSSYQIPNAMAPAKSGCHATTGHPKIVGMAVDTGRKQRLNQLREHLRHQPSLAEREKAVTP
jgi:hypothetical protein